MNGFDKDGVMRIVQYKKPPVWMEMAGYLGAVCLFAATIVNPGAVLWPALLTAHLLYWNYRLFVTLREYVKYVNATQISSLLMAMADEESNKHKEGTISESHGLINGDDDE